MAGQTEFLQAIQELERLGETNGNQLSMEEINSYFSDMKLEEKQRGLYSNAVLPERRRVVEYCRQQRGRLSCKGRILHLPWTRENGVSLLCAKQRLLF